MGLVLYGLGPSLHDRTQRKLLASFRIELEQAANAVTGFGGPIAARAPEIGEAVAILELGDLRVQEVVVEGVGASQTRGGPGHVPGTAALGQPGNSVVVARRSAFGGPFSSLQSLAAGDEIVATTTQGQTVYEVTDVAVTELTSSPDDDGGLMDPEPVDDGSEPRTARSVDGLYGPSDGDQLTLVTAATGRPWNKSAAVVVVASMKAEPFEPTAQNGRSARQTGREGESSARASVVLTMLLFALTLSGSVAMYRWLAVRTAYLLTVGPVIAVTVIAAETVSRLLPAWI